jgi:hypothetical protein
VAMTEKEAETENQAVILVVLEGKDQEKTLTLELQTTFQNVKEPDKNKKKRHLPLFLFFKFFKRFTNYRNTI